MNTITQYNKEGTNGQATNIRLQTVRTYLDATEGRDADGMPQVPQSVLEQRTGGQRQMSDILHTFHNMKHRCYYPSDKKYKYYGEKGITICDQWMRNPVSFANWSEKNGYEQGKQIHRKNKAEGYSPDNCEWLTKEEHALNHIRIAKEKPKDKGLKTIIIRNVPGELHAALRMWAFKRGISLNALLIEIAAKAAKEGKK